MKSKNSYLYLDACGRIKQVLTGELSASEMQAIGSLLTKEGLIDVLCSLAGGFKKK